MSRFALWPLVLLCCVLANTAFADERILAFASDIAIAPDASMSVAETIRVRAEGNQIRHGIYRDFPTDYKDNLGNRVHVAFEPESLTRDGSDEPFHTEGQGNGVRVYFGSESTLLSPGEYTYVLRYRTTRQLGFFADHDELYWNVTGNGWDFPIDAASATVALPGAVARSQLRIEGYTGEQGAKGQDYVANADAPSHATFRTTRALAPREGLTIVVGFPKGIVSAPTSEQRVRWFLTDNGGVLVGGIGLLLIWAYYLWQWFRVGRDPKPGVIIAQYEAPEGCSPGMLRHVERMAYDDTCFASDLVDLAVRGRVEIREQSGTYSLLKKSSGNRDVLPAPEAGILRDLLGASRSTLEFKQSQHTTIAAALKNHKETLKQTDVGRFFNTNSKLVIPGAIVGLIALLAGVFALGAVPRLAGAGFMLVWLGGWTLGVSALVVSVIRAWRAPPGIGTYFSAIFLTLFSLPFLAGEVFGLGAFAMLAGPGLAVIAVLLVATNFAFFHWMKAPTLEGAQIARSHRGPAALSRRRRTRRARSAESATGDARTISDVPAVRARARRRENVGRQVRGDRRPCRRCGGRERDGLVRGLEHLESFELHERHRVVAELVDLLVVERARIIVGRRRVADRQAVAEAVVAAAAGDAQRGTRVTPAASTAAR